MEKSLLIIQFRTEPDLCEVEQREYKQSIATPHVPLIFKNAVTNKLPWGKPKEVLGGCDGVILAGSGEFDFDGGRAAEDEKRQIANRLASEMKPFLDYLATNHTPTLGICFGHQLIAQAHGIPVVHDKSQAKIGSHDITLTEDGKNDPLFRDLPERFTVQYGHKDSLSRLPDGAVVLATGDNCTYSALRWGLRRYSVQFHPELDAEDIIERFSRYPDYVSPGKDVRDLVRQSPHATHLLRNFVRNFVAVS